MEGRWERFRQRCKGGHPGQTGRHQDSSAEIPDFHGFCNEKTRNFVFFQNMLAREKTLHF